MVFDVFNHAVLTLTLTLSLGERGKVRLVFPLPEGEG
jgi:hypothetical protein